jgi:hypothetical protein
MVASELHSGIDALDVGSACSIYADGFVDHRNQDTVYNETCSLVNLYRSLAKSNGDLLNLLNGFFGVLAPAMTSTSFITGAGLKKCMPTTAWKGPCRSL